MVTIAWTSGLRESIPYYRDVTLPPPDDRALDLATRCWKCHCFRYFDVNNEGVFVDDAWMCHICMRLL